MPRKPRDAPGGIIYHVLNRAVGRMTLFKKDADSAAFEQALGETIERLGTRVLGYCVMPNHFHLVAWPREDGELSEFMRIFTVTQTRRWHARHRTTGTGPLYQGRFKAFPVQADEHFLTVARYVEQNALRAGKVERAEEWRWCSLWPRRHPSEAGDGPVLGRWPVSEPQQWLRTVNARQSEAELEALRLCVQRGRPFGGDRWVKRITRELGLESSFRPRGRPRITR